MLQFITGNENKFRETELMLGIPLVQTVVDVPEIQSLDAKEVMHEKARAARLQCEGPFIIEDTSLYLGCLNGKLPGPFIKSFEEAIGNDGIASLAEHRMDCTAEAVTLFAYSARGEETVIFEGRVSGRIVKPRGTLGFGWSCIFEPEGYSLTYGEMAQEDVRRISMRARAAEKLLVFLKERKDA